MVAMCGNGRGPISCRFAGFSPDPYEDYSQPWFNTRKVLRGGSFASSARIARRVTATSSHPTQRRDRRVSHLCALK